MVNKSVLPVFGDLWPYLVIQFFFFNLKDLIGFIEQLMNQAASHLTRQGELEITL